MSRELHKSAPRLSLVKNKGTLNANGSSVKKISILQCRKKTLFSRKTLYASLPTKIPETFCEMKPVQVEKRTMPKKKQKWDP